MKKAVSVLIVICILFCAAACGTQSGTQSKDMVFNVDELGITLSSDYYRFKNEGFTGSFKNADSMLFVLRENKENIKSILGDIDLSGYEQALRAGNASRNPSEIITEENVRYFEYTFSDSETHEDYTYFTIPKESENAFWVIQFCCKKDDYSKLKSSFIKYASGITFDESVKPADSSKSSSPDFFSQLLGTDLTTVSVRELNMSVPKDFYSSRIQGYTGCFGRRDGSVTFLTLREGKEYLKCVLEKDSISLDEYIEILHYVNESNNPSEIQQSGKIKYFDCVFKAPGGGTFTHFMTAAECEKAFWTIELVCAEADYQTMKDQFIRWAGTVKMNDADALKADVSQFTVDEMTIYLPTEFVEEEADPEYEDAYWTSDYADVYASSYEKKPGDTLDGYWKVFETHYSGSELKKGSWGDIRYAYYIEKYEDMSYSTCIVLLESDKNIWEIDFVTYGDLTDELLPEYEIWAESIAFN